MDARVRTSLLYDFYGPLLTERQQRFIELYFGEDLSLGEIAAEFQISRQAVHDILHRSEAALEALEAKLGLLRQYQRQKRRYGRLRALLEELRERGLTPPQEALVQEMTALLEAMGREVD